MQSPPFRILIGGRLASALLLSPSMEHHKHHEQRQCDPTHYLKKKYIPERRAHKEVIYSECLSWTH